MKNVLRYLRMARPLLQFAAEELAALDENETGNDDKAAVALEYVCNVIDALTQNKTIPAAPKALQK